MANRQVKSGTKNKKTARRRSVIVLLDFSDASESGTGSGFHGDLRQPHPLSKFLQFDYPPQQLRMPWQRNLSAFQYAGPLFHLYSYWTKRRDRTSQFESPSARRSTLELADVTVPALADALVLRGGKVAPGAGVLLGAYFAMRLLRPPIYFEVCQI
jgi:hypothetical protein